MATAPKPMAVALDWIEAHCVIPDGFRKGAPFELYDYQLTYLAAFYSVRADAGWVPENPVLGPAFVYRRGLLVGPQKLGKGPHTAAHVCLEGAGPALFAGWAGSDDGYACAEHGCPCGWEYAYEPGEPMGMRWPTPLIQITAFSQDQTDNIYDALRPMIDDGPLSGVVPRTGEEFIRLPGGGRIDVVSSSALSRLGQRITFAGQDEVGVWTKYNKMTKVADSQHRNLAGMGGRASMTTNAWDSTENSVAQQDHDTDDPGIYRQKATPPRSLSYRNKAERRKIHRIVYPADVLRENGGHVDLDAIEAEAAGIFAKDPAQAERFFGNIVTAGAGSAIDPEVWTEVSSPGREIAPGERIGVGFDGSISEDCTAFIACTADGHLFVPIVEIDVHGVPTLRPTIWTRPEHAPPGWRIPRLEVEQAKVAIFATYSVGRLLADPPKWATEIERWADWHNPERVEDAIVMAFDTNQAKRMSAACDRFSTLLGERNITHAGHVILTEHVLAMVKKRAHVRAEDMTDGRTRHVFTKGSDGRKIDAGIAAVLAVEAAMTMPAVVEPGPVFAY